MSKFKSFKHKLTGYGHAKTRLRYHIIFTTKYRRKCLEDIKDSVIDAFKYAESISHFKIHEMETDRDHIHLLIEFRPAYSIEQTVRRLKQVTTNYLYEHVGWYLEKFYRGNKRKLWTGGYFVSTIGDVSEQKTIEYIRNQTNRLEDHQIQPLG